MTRAIKPPDETRRRLLFGMAAAPALIMIPSLFSLSGSAKDATAAEELTPTPACTDGDEDDATPSLTEGPYFTPNSPERASLLETGVTGARLVISGKVLTRSCQPVAAALVDFWQCDASGSYDNSGYRLRGHQYTAADGSYQLETIVPAIYPGRTRHIHVKAQAPSQPVLTTQLFFPGESLNARDGIFRSDCLMAITQADGYRDARFNFVLNLP